MPNEDLTKENFVHVIPCEPRKKIFFIGVTEFSLACFNQLIELHCSIVGCAYTDEKIIVKRQPNGIKNATYIDFKSIAEKHNIPGIHFDKLNPEEFENKVQALNPELIIVAGWHYLLGEKITSLPALGIIGLHASLLPKYRGGSPLTWQLINGEKEGGVTLFYIEKGTDTGDVIGQISFPIGDGDTIKDLLYKSQKSALELLQKYIPMICAECAPRLKQNNELATYYRQRIPADGEINWDDTPQNIKNFIRAQTKPYFGAFTYINNRKVIIWDADIITEDISPKDGCAPDFSCAKSIFCEDVACKPVMGNVINLRYCYYVDNYQIIILIDFLIIKICIILPDWLSVGSCPSKRNLQFLQNRLCCCGVFDM